MSLLRIPIIALRKRIGTKQSTYQYISITAQIYFYCSPLLRIKTINISHIYQSRHIGNKSQHILILNNNSKSMINCGLLWYHWKLVWKQYKTKIIFSFIDRCTTQSWILNRIKLRTSLSNPSVLPPKVFTSVRLNLINHLVGFIPCQICLYFSN